jgi:thymus-specific serine protease
VSPHSELLFSNVIRIYSRFDADFIENVVTRKNVVFGGLRPVVRNIFFTNGAMDPLRTLGVLEDLNDEAAATVIPDTSRGRDLGSINPSVDTPEMTAVKRRSRDMIIEWLLEV